MERFEVQPGAIDSVAAAFQREADDLETALQGFQSVAYSVNDAFGPWGVSHDMLREYLATAHETLKGLGNVVAALEADATRLRTSQANYGQAEQASSFGPP